MSIVIDKIPVYASEVWRTTRADPRPLDVLLGELIDNALDAQATKVELFFDAKQRRLVVKDNGRGMDDLRVLFSLGASKRHGSATESGVWGIGFKDAAFQLGDQTTVFSCAGHAPTWARCSYAKAGRDFEVEREEGRTLFDFRRQTGLSRGTVIAINHIDLERYGVDAWVSMLDRGALTQKFWPAKVKGCDICIELTDTLRREHVGGRQVPLERWLTERTTVSTSDGRAFQCQVGLLRHQTSQSGITLIRGHRVLRTAWVGPTKGATRIYAEVWLPGGATDDRQTDWMPDRNKLGLLHTRELRVIATAIERLVQPHVKQDQERSLQIRYEEVRSELEGMLNRIASPAHGTPPEVQAGRDPNRSHPGTHPTTGTHPKKRRTRRPKRKRGRRIPVDEQRQVERGFRIEPEEWSGADTSNPGRVDHLDQDQPVTIKLNLRHPHVGFYFQSTDPTNRGYGLGVICAALLANSDLWDVGEQQMRLPMMRGLDVNARFRRLLTDFHGDMFRQIYLPAREDVS